MRKDSAELPARRRKRRSGTAKAGGQGARPRSPNACGRYQQCPWRSTLDALRGRAIAGICSRPPKAGGGPRIRGGPLIQGPDGDEHLAPRARRCRCALIGAAAPRAPETDAGQGGGSARHRPRRPSVSRFRSWQSVQPGRSSSCSRGRKSAKVSYNAGLRASQGDSGRRVCGQILAPLVTRAPFRSAIRASRSNPARQRRCHRAGREFAAENLGP